MAQAYRDWLVMLLACCVAGGCATPALSPVAPAPLPNPVFVPNTNGEYVFSQTIDVLDDYFIIDREETVKQVGDLITEGQVITHPLTGATFLEPWRGDSANLYERTHSTLQSTRRTAVVRVIPTNGGHLIDVQVAKELENLPRAEFATASAATLRHDGSIERYSDPVSGGVANAGWIPLGRDVAFEQRLLCDVQNRLVNPARPLVGHQAQPAQ